MQAEGIQNSEGQISQQLYGWLRSNVARCPWQALNCDGMQSNTAQFTHYFMHISELGGHQCIKTTLHGSFVSPICNFV